MSAVDAPFGLDPSPRKPRRLSHTFTSQGSLIFLILCMSVAAYLPSSTSEFFLDDYLHLVRSSDLTLRNILEAWYLRASDLVPYWWVPGGISVMYFRPIVTLSFALDRLVWGTAPLGYHLTNLLVHLLVTVLVYRTGTLMHTNRVAAFLASIIFLLHPVHAGAVQWISGRTDVLMTLFYLIGFDAYLRFRLGPRWRYTQVAITLLAFCCSLGSKEAAVTFPLVLLGSEFMVEPRATRIGAIPKGRLALIGSVMLVTVAYALVRLPEVIHSAMPQPYVQRLDIRFLPDLFLQLVLYLLACTLGVPILPFHNLEAWKLQTPLLTVLGVVLAGLLFLAWRRYRRNSNVRFWGFWFAITLLPFLPIMMGQRLIYLPSVAFCFVLGTVFANWRSAESGMGLRRKAHAVALSIVLVVYTGLTSLQGRILADLASEVQTVTQRMLEYQQRGDSRCRIFILNAWMPHSLWIAEMFRWTAGDPSLDVRVLTLSPEFVPSALAAKDPAAGYLLRALYGPPLQNAVPRASTDNASTLVLESDSAAFFGSPFERFFLLGRARFLENEEVRTEDFTARASRIEGGFPRRIAFMFRDSLSDPHNLFLVCRGLGVERIEF